MRIAVFSRSTVEHFVSGGMETHLKNLVRGLSKRGHEITVITTSHPDSLYTTKEISKSKVRYVYIGDTTPGLNPITFLERMYVSLKMMTRSEKGEGSKNYFRESSRIFEKLHSKKPFDVIISQSTSAFGIIDNCPIPIISVIHGAIKAEIENRFKSNKTFKNWVRFFIADLPRWYVELLTSNRKFFKKVEKVVAVSNELKKQFLHEHPHCKNKVEVIANGVDSQFFKPSDSKYPDFTLLYIGRMDREKGVDLIIKSVQILKKRKKEVHAKLIGGGIHFEELKAHAKNLNVEKQVEILGQIPNEKLLPYYQKSHVFVLPSRRNEGHPMTISEAFCCGLPVIATKKGGLSELIEDGKTGFFVNENDSIDIANKVESLVNNPEKLKSISKFARKIGEKKYSRDAMISGYQKVIDEVTQ